MSTSPKFCAECGASLLEGAKFCPQCGAKTAVAAAPAPAAVETPAKAPSAEVPAATVHKPQVQQHDEHHRSKAVHTAYEGDGFVDPLAAVLKGRDDEGDGDDQLGLPPTEAGHGKKSFPMGLIALGFFLVVAIGIVAYVATNAEMNARFQCAVLGKLDKCETDEDRQFALDQAEKKEEVELMTHHYGNFDLGFTPEKDTSVTITQKRYEETRDAFVKRIRDGATDARSLKDKKIGEWKQGKSADGQTKGFIAFSATPANPVTWQPMPGKDLVLPMVLSNLPLLEKEQADGTGKRLTYEDVKAIEKRKQEPEKAAKEGETVHGQDPTLKIKTTDISTWIYEIHLSAVGYKPRDILFFEQPAPPDVDPKKLEAAGWTVRKFKRTPDGKFVIDNAAFDLLPEPKTIQTRYIQGLKEQYCLQQSKDYQGKTEQGKKDAEELLWEQKAFTKELLDIAHQNDADPEFMALKEKEFKGYECPKMGP